MICLFHPKTKRDIVIERNGDYIIDKYVTRSLITEKIDGTYEFNFTMLNSADYKLLNLVCKGSIVKTNDEHGDEIFRIESVKKDKKYIEVYARQITIDETLGLWLEDVRPTNLNGQATLSYLVDNAIGETELIVSSDIAKNNTAYYVRKNMYEALACEDTAFLNRWGGEIKRRGYTLYINSRIGMDKGFTIESRKNLLGFNIKEENTVITAIKPMGFDGISADIVYSKYKDDYPRLYVKEIKWEDVKLKSEEEPDGYATLAEAQAELKKRAEKEFAENKIDLIQATYEIDFIELAKTEEYKNIKSVQSAAIGDDVTVWIDTYGLELKARVTERQYSPTLDRRIKTTLSTRINTTVPPKPSDILQQIQQQLPPNKLPTLENYIDSMITSGFKNSYYISRPNEALWLDNPDINKAVNVVRMNKNGLGFSQTGYYGKYVYGFTIDGKINADLITVGQLNGALIKAGTLTADKIEVSFKDDIKDQIQGDISDSIIPTIKDEVTGEITNQVLKDYVTKSEFTVDKEGLTNKIEGVREEITTKVTESESNTDEKLKEINKTVTNLDTKFSTANGVIQQQVNGQSETIQNIYSEIEGQEQQLLETNKIISQSVNNLTTDINGIKATSQKIINSDYTNIIPYAYFDKPNEVKKHWNIMGGNLYNIKNQTGLQNKSNEEIQIISTPSLLNERKVSLYIDIFAEKNVASRVYLIGSKTEEQRWDWANEITMFKNNQSGARKFEGIQIPKEINYIMLQITNTGTNKNTDNVVWIRKANLVIGEIAKGGTLFNAEQLSNLSITSDEIKTEVSKKVDNNKIISTINQTAEGVKIEASKINLKGYTTFEDLKQSGRTTIDGGNIKTGIIEGIGINSCYFEGRNMMYIREGGVFSCDGNVYAQDFFIPSKGSCSIEPHAFFNTNISVKSTITSEDKIICNNNISTKNLTTNGLLYSKSNASIDGELTIGKRLYAKQNINVEGKITANNDIVANRNIGCNGEITTKSVTSSGLIYGKADGSFEGGVTIGRLLYARQNVSVEGDLWVTGNKHCIQKTKNYGDVKFYATEDTSSLLTDTATKKIFTTKKDKNGYSCKILIDEYVQETINTELPYNIYIDKLTFGDYMVAESDRHKDYFILRSDREISFKFKLEGYRKGFEEERKSNNKKEKFNIKSAIIK